MVTPVKLRFCELNEIIQKIKVKIIIKLHIVIEHPNDLSIVIFGGTDDDMTDPAFDDHVAVEVEVVGVVHVVEFVLKFEHFDGEVEVEGS